MTLDKIKKSLSAPLEPDTTKVKLSLSQLWVILGTVVAAAFYVANGINSLKRDTADLKTDFINYQGRADANLLATRTMILELRADRTDSLREWANWRGAVDNRLYKTESDVRILDAQQSRASATSTR